MSFSHSALMRSGIIECGGELLKELVNRFIIGGAAHSAIIDTRFKHRLDSGNQRILKGRRDNSAVVDLLKVLAHKHSLLGHPLNEALSALKLILVKLCQIVLNKVHHITNHKNAFVVASALTDSGRLEENGKLKEGKFLDIHASDLDACPAEQLIELRGRMVDLTERARFLLVSELALVILELISDKRTAHKHSLVDLAEAVAHTVADHYLLADVISVFINEAILVSVVLDPTVCKADKERYLSVSQTSLLALFAEVGHNSDIMPSLIQMRSQGFGQLIIGDDLVYTVPILLEVGSYYIILIGK